MMDPDQLYRAATALVELEKCERALPLLRQVIALEPDRYEPHVQMGNCFLALDQIDDGLVAFERAAAIDPRRAWAHRRRAAALGRLRRRDEAYDAAKMALSCAPRSVFELVAVSSTARNIDRYEEAVSAAQQAIAIDPESTGAWDALHWATVGRDQALSELAARKVLELEPDNADHLRTYYDHLENLDECVDVLRRAIRIEPKPHLLRALAAIELARGENEAAKLAAAGALRAEPETEWMDAWVSGALGSPLEARDRLMASEVFLKGPVGRGCCPPWTHFNGTASQLSRRGGDIEVFRRLSEEQVAHYERFLEKHPDSSCSAYSRGLLLGALGRHDEVVEKTRAFIDGRPPSDQWVSVVIAESQLVAGKPITVEHRSKTDWSFVIAGHHAAAKADWPTAESCYRRAVALRPTYFMGRYALAYVLHQTGRTADAKVQFARALHGTPNVVSAMSVMLEGMLQPPPR